MQGHLDGIFENYLQGWAWNPLEPDQAIDLDVYINGDLHGTVKADKFREDLLAANIGKGNNGFIYLLNGEDIGSIYFISVRVAETELELVNSPICLGKMEANAHLNVFKLDPYNIASALENLKSVEVDHLLIDVNDNCNLACVYCPNVRSYKEIELEQFESFLSQCIGKVSTFQFGCGQEPTLDSRLPDFYKILSKSKLEFDRLTMITNGTLLHQYNLEDFCSYGLTDLQVSIDTVDPKIHAMTRRGIPLERILKNLQIFREKCPDIDIIFSVVVNALTIDGIEDLIAFGESLGVSHYYLREITDILPAVTASPRSNDYHNWLTQLTLSFGDFQKLQKRLQHHHSLSKIVFAPREYIGDFGQEMRDTNVVVRSF